MWLVAAMATIQRPGIAARTKGSANDLLVGADRDIAHEDPGGTPAGQVGVAPARAISAPRTTASAYAVNARRRSSLAASLRVRAEAGRIVSARRAVGDRPALGGKRPHEADERWRDVPEDGGIACRDGGRDVGAEERAQRRRHRTRRSMDRRASALAHWPKTSQLA